MYNIGIDFGGTNIKIGLVSEKGRVIAKRELSTHSYKKRGEIIAAICDSVNNLICAEGIQKKDIGGLGVGVPGLVNVERGYVYDLVNVRDWRGVPLKTLLEKRLKIKTCVDNDANAMAMGELYYGALKGVRNGACITLGTGVGGGIIIDGRLYRGSYFAAGEVGHVTINEEGLRCGCGNRGCLEAYVGNRSLIFKRAGSKYSEMTPKLLSEAARKGDKIAKKIWKEVGKHLGVVIASLINILDLETIVIGGGISNAGELLLDPAREEVNRRISYRPYRRFKIVRTALGSVDAGIIGAASLAYER